MPSSSSQQQPKGAPSWHPVSILRFLLADLPLVLLFGLLCTTLLVQHAYKTYVIPITQSYKRIPIDYDNDKDMFYQNYDDEFTYYNRLCGPDDISTTSAADLLIGHDFTRRDAANVMLQHGAVAVPQVLSNDTATELRAYLVGKHEERKLGQLSYNEIFWDEISRMSLGIGTSDHPVLSKALQEVGSSDILKTTLEGIVGPDPAVLEISTLTSLNGAEDQGIHTDSDWFGSSLLYSRSFLHSYSLFIALQDTSQDLGATTVCPGTHVCADQDLEELCLEHGAFEISTNGHTGEDGLLYKGDALLFNQNIWHRGPQNVDPDGTDRFMFILTFASAKDIKKAKHAQDLRRQGLGTYYYQRFNMWGTTYSMLKDATTTMIQPFAGLRALGFTKTRGITWIHQFCQQFANGDEFYNDYELEDLKSKVFDFYKVPDYLQSTTADTWEAFIPETLALWISFLAKMNAAAGMLYLLVCALIRVVAPSRGSQFPKVLLLSLGSVVLVALAVTKFMEQTELAQSVTTGDVFARPFSSSKKSKTSTITKSSANYMVGPTTFPERHDVLIATRFDADFLGSFNRFVDFHPGNRLWQELISEAAALPHAALHDVAEYIVREINEHKESGLASRFLWQQPETGAWILMTEADAVKLTERALIEAKKPLAAKLSLGLKRRLADARFSSLQGTAMARTLFDSIEPYWSAKIYQLKAQLLQIETCGALTSPSPAPSSHAFTKHSLFSTIKTSTLESSRPYTRQTTIDRLLSIREEDEDDEENDDIVIGNKVWVYYGGPEWEIGELVDIEDEERCQVFFFNSGTTEEVQTDDLKEYAQFKEGDRVEVDYNQDATEYFAGIITHVHPDGRCSVLYDDGERQDKIGRQYLVLL